MSKNRLSNETSPTVAHSRPVLDAVVQSSVVELFQSRDIAVAPLPPFSRDPSDTGTHELLGSVRFSSQKLSGLLDLSWEEQVFALFSPDATSPSDRQDLVREMTNQLVGRIKNRLIRFQIVMTIGVPTVFDARVQPRQQLPKNHQIVYPCRTLRGEVVVALTSNLDPGGLNYSGAAVVANEGDLILF